MNISFRIVNIFTWFTIFKVPYQRDILKVCFHFLKISSVILENCVALVVVGYVGDSDLGARLVLKLVHDEEPRQPPRVVVQPVNDTAV